MVKAKSLITFVKKWRVQKNYELPTFVIVKIKTKTTITSPTLISDQSFQEEIKKAEKGPFYSILEAKKLLKQWRASRGEK